MVKIVGFFVSIEFNTKDNIRSYYNNVISILIVSISLNTTTKESLKYNFGACHA